MSVYVCGVSSLPPFPPFSCLYACVSVLTMSYLQPNPSQCPCVAHLASITGVVGGNGKAKASFRRVMLVILAKQRTSVSFGVGEGIKGSNRSMFEEEKSTLSWTVNLQPMDSERVPVFRRPGRVEGFCISSRLSL